jgi:hypothetical protein
MMATCTPSGACAWASLLRTAPGQPEGDDVDERSQMFERTGAFGLAVVVLTWVQFPLWLISSLSSRVA